MRTPITRWALPATLLVIALAGCSSGSSGSAAAPAAATSGSTGSTAPASAATPSAAPSADQQAASGKAPNPCDLVTASDASATLGASVPKATALAAGLYRECAYRSGAKSLVILDRQIDQTTFDKSAQANPGVVKPVTSLGAPAYSASTGLLVWKNGTEVVIALLPGSSASEQADEHLATSAIARL
jgi:hypothetical protein